MELLVILYCTFSLILVAVSIPLINHKIPPNGLYGFRIRATMENPDLWYPVNHYFAKRLLVTGIAVFITSISLYFIPDISLDTYALGVLLVFCIFFVPSLIASLRYLNALKNS